MSIFDKLLKPVSDIFNSVIDKVAGDKIDEKDKALLKLQGQEMLYTALQNEEQGFRDFVIEYEGAAKDMPRFIQVLRGSVRPVLTYFLAGLLAYSMFASWEYEVQRFLFQLNLISLGFWYGERALKNSGIIEAWKTKKNGAS